MRHLSTIAVVSLLVAAAGCSGSATDKGDELRGAGSTFVNDIMDKWGHEYEGLEGGCKVNYRSLGSGAGIKFIMAREVDFGCSDAPMTDAELAKACAAGGDIVHVPLVLGAVVPAYHLEEVNEPLRFTGPVLADIYLGKIKKWNDKALHDLNPKLGLPARDIIVVRRRDGSGTTDIWTDYLSKTSPAWQHGPGRGVEVKWPTGHAEVGNEGVAEYVKKTDGSIGYVELSYAHRLDLSFGLVQNREGEFIRARQESVTAAAQSILTEIPDDLRFSLTNPAGKDSYPISGATWALLYQRQPHAKGQQLVDFFGWVLDKGQEYAAPQFYAPLPESLAARARKQLDRVEVAQ